MLLFKGFLYLGRMACDSLVLMCGLLRIWRFCLTSPGKLGIFPAPLVLALTFLAGRGPLEELEQQWKQTDSLTAALLCVS